MGDIAYQMATPDREAIIRRQLRDLTEAARKVGEARISPSSRVGDAIVFMEAVLDNQLHEREQNGMGGYLK